MGKPVGENERPHRREYMRRWRKENPLKAYLIERNKRKNPDYYKRRNRLSRNKNPEKWAAWAAVARAVRNGTLIRPDVCSNCQRRCKPHGHHEDYAKPLEVVWLCRACHLALDGIALKFPHKDDVL